MHIYLFMLYIFQLLLAVIELGHEIPQYLALEADNLVLLGCMIDVACGYMKISNLVRAVAIF